MSHQIIKRDLKSFILNFDRYFISKVANRIIEIKESKLLSFNGNYEYFLEKKKLKNSYIK